MSNSCTRCKLHAGAKTICLMGTGPRRAKVMVVGEAPGKSEDEGGEPFIGRSGKLLTDALELAGFDRKDLYITNAVHCRPPDNKTPTKGEIKTCKYWLDKEIERVKPEFVLLLGNTPLISITGAAGIKKARGKPIEKDGITYFPTYHPAFALRDMRFLPVLEGDLKHFHHIINQGGALKAKGLRVRIVKDERTFRRALADIKKNWLLGFDTETSGLDPYLPGSWVTSIGLGTRKYQWCFPLQHTKGPLYNKQEEQQVWVDRLTDALKGKTLVAQNGKFDTKWMHAIHGVWWKVHHDTMLMHYNLNENSLHGLSFLANQYFGAADYDIPLEEKHGFGPLNRHCEYLGLDVFYTRKLFFKIRRQLKKDRNMWDLYNNLTMPVSDMYARAESFGIYLDPKKAEAQRKVWLRRAARALKELNELCPSDAKRKDKKTKEWIYGVNWSSPQQVATVLFGDRGLTSLKQTAGGKDSTDEDTLLQLAKDDPVPQLILDYRGALKNLGFIQSWQKRAVNNRVHCNFKIHGTVTGRPSCEEPNLQQTPRLPKMRGCFTAPEGWVLVSADFSQVELRIVAHMSGDKALTFAYQTGGDVHTKTVQTIFHILKPTKDERKKGKAINFGFIYGMWWKKFVEYARNKYDMVFTDNEAARIRKEFFRMYCGLPPWQKKQKRFANVHGYVRSIFGRKRRLPEAMDLEDTPAKREAERQAVNSPVQSFASDMNLTAAVELGATLPSTDFRIVSTTHDEILAEVRVEVLMETAQKIKSVMEAPKLFQEMGIELNIPIIAEVAAGPWGSGKELKDLH